MKNRKIKVIQVIPSLNVGGAEVMCENLSYKLKEKGNDVIIISFYNNHTPITERLENNGIKIIYLNKKKGFDFSLLFKLNKIFRNEKPDVIHSHLYSLKYIYMSLLFSKKIRIIHTIHNVAEKESTLYDQKLNNYIFKHKIAIPVALSKEIQDTVCSLYKLDKSCVPIVFNGIDLSKCIKKENYNFGKKIIITHVGRFFEQKNHKVLINAFSKINKECECELRLIGNGEKFEEIVNLVNSLGLKENVVFMGQQKDVYDHLYNSDLFVMPSLYEGVPLALIEAMGTGLPIIVSNVGGISDMLENEKNALLIRPDEEDIINAFFRLKDDESLRSKLGKMAVARSKDFSSFNMAKKYLDIYIDK